MEPQRMWNSRERNCAGLAKGKSEWLAGLCFLFLTFPIILLFSFYSPRLSLCVRVLPFTFSHTHLPSLLSSSLLPSLLSFPHLSSLLCTPLVPPSSALLCPPLLFSTPSHPSPANSAGGRQGATSVCNKCKGSGIEVKLRPIGPGMMQQIQSPCHDCGGSGEFIRERDKCKKCKGKRVLEHSHKLEVSVV